MTRRRRRDPLPLPLACDFAHVARRGGRVAGWCPKCLDVCWRVDCRRNPGKVLCSGCVRWVPAAGVLAEPHAGSVTARDWDRAAWAKQRADAELADLDMRPLFDDVLGRIMRRVEARRAAAESLRAELAALGVAVVRLPDGSGRLRAAAGVVTADLAARCREYREELLEGFDSECSSANDVTANEKPRECDKHSGARQSGGIY
jgi:hypothetical protein